MTISSLARSTITNNVKYEDFLAGNPAYSPPSFYSIATVTAAGGEAFLTFTSIPSTYKSLQIRGIYQDTYTTAGTGFNLNLRFNSDSANNYANHRLIGNGTSVSASGQITQSKIFVVGAGKNAYTGTTSMFGTSITDIIDYANTSKNKTVRAIAGADTNGNANSDNEICLSSGLWLSTSAITSITLLPDVTAFYAGSTFALYGIN